jgi:hypothetical protein
MPHYIDNKKFYQEIKNYHDKKKKNKNEIMSNYLGQSFLDIARNFSLKRKFSGYPFVEDMVSDAVFDCVKYGHKFDPYHYKNPFAYFTKICLYAFFRRIYKEKTQLYTKYKALDKSEVFRQLHQQFDLDDQTIIDDIGYSESARENMNEFIRDFEVKLLKKE